MQIDLILNHQNNNEYDKIMDIKIYYLITQQIE